MTGDSLSAIGRDQLLSLLRQERERGHALSEALRHALNAEATMRATLQTAQARGTELVEEARTLRSIYVDLRNVLGLEEAASVVDVFEHVARLVERSKHEDALPGWTCIACGAFNGEARGPRGICRACNALRVVAEPLMIAGGTLGVDDVA